VTIFPFPYSQGLPDHPALPFENRNEDVAIDRLLEALFAKILRFAVLLKTAFLVNPYLRKANVFELS